MLRCNKDIYDRMAIFIIPSLMNWAKNVKVCLLHTEAIFHEDGRVFIHLSNSYFPLILKYSNHSHNNQKPASPSLRLLQPPLPFTPQSSKNMQSSSRMGQHKWGQGQLSSTASIHVLPKSLQLRRLKQLNVHHRHPRQTVNGSPITSISLWHCS